MHKDQRFMEAFRMAEMNFSGLYNRMLSEKALSLQQFALLNLLNSAGRIPMTEASFHLRISKPAVTHIVDQLEERKLLKRVPNPEDRRSILLEIQSKGQKMVVSVQEEVFGLLFKTLDQFKKGEQEVVRSFYEQLCPIIVTHLNDEKVSV